MIGHDHLEAGIRPLKLEAIDWAARLAIGPVTDEDWRDFESWRKSSPAHDDAFQNAASFMEELHGIGQSITPGMTDAPATAQASPYLSRRAMLGGSAIAASVAGGLVISASPLGLWPSLSELMADERTMAGERRSFSPMAGVDVELNSRSSVSATDRGMKLVAGEVFVSLADRKAPFQVDAGGLVVTASQARFDVSRYDDEYCVTCVEGAVSATLAGNSRRVGAGEAVSYRAGEVRHRRVDLTAATAWRRGLLIFENRPLASAISEINRYFSGRVILRDSALAGRPITGVFHINQIELAVVQIQNLTGASATRLPGGLVLLS